MPIPLRQQFLKELNALNAKNPMRHPRLAAPPTRRASFVVSRIREIIDQDIRSKSGVFRAQSEVARLFAYVAHGLEGINLLSYYGKQVPGRSELQRFLGDELNNLIFGMLLVDNKDLNAMRLFCAQRLKPKLLTAIELIEPLRERTSGAT